MRPSKRRQILTAPSWKRRPQLACGIHVCRRNHLRETMRSCLDRHPQELRYELGA